MDTKEQHNVWDWNYTIVQVEYKVLCYKKIFWRKIAKVVGILKLIDDEEITSFWLCQSAEMDFQCLARPRNVSVDLKYYVLCL